jgi:hypothetical protein
MLTTAGCASPIRISSYRLPLFRAASIRSEAGVAPASRSRSASGVSGSAALVERALHGQGLRFGTDGSVGALFAYIEARHLMVPATQARSGDILFFNMGGTSGGCANHVGLVESVDLEGRLTFKESRGGLVRKSYVTPGAPRARRDPSGLVLNTFMRAKHINDPPGARYFAGEMLCAVGRIQGG